MDSNTYEICDSCFNEGEPVKINKGASINYVSRRGGGGLAKYLCSKFAYGGGRGSKIGKILLT